MSQRENLLFSPTAQCAIHLRLEIRVILLVLPTQDAPVSTAGVTKAPKPNVEYAADDGPLFSLLGFLMRSFPANRAACCVNVLADVSASCALQFRPLFLYRRQRRSRGIRLQVVHELSRHTVAFPPKQIQAFTRITHSTGFAHKKEE